jgi:hypothetical protein
MAGFCIVEGCGKTRDAKGYCKSHYARLRRHGDPTGHGAATPMGEAQDYFNEVVLKYEGDECLIWPFWRNADGYGYVRQNGSMRQASRVVCTIIHGDPPTPKHEAAHSCGKGSAGCVTKGHLSWKTHRENEADKIVHGTAPRGESHGFAKITVPDVVAIRAAPSSRGLAEKFGLAKITIRQIRAGKTWRHVPFGVDIVMKHEEIQA